MVVKIRGRKALIFSEKVTSHIPLHTYADHVPPIADYVLEDGFYDIHRQKKQRRVDKIIRIAGAFLKAVYKLS
jgi:hypothetical protein